jgi:DNA polymerase-3 subunit alpha (Gram-positive type)
MAAKMCSFLIFDFETGGLDSNINAITELAAIAISGDTLQEIGRVHELVSPYEKQYDDKALQVTGISIDLLEAEGIPLVEVAKKTEELLKKAYVHTRVKSAKTILVGHNVLFDIGFLHQLLSSLGNSSKIMEKYLDGSYDAWGHYQPRYIDTMTIAKEIWGGEDQMKDWKLGTVLEKGNVDLIDAHRAMNDVLGTKEFLIDSINRRRNIAGDGVGTKSSTRFRDHFRFQRV